MIPFGQIHYDSSAFSKNGAHRKDAENAEALFFVFR